MSETIRFTLDGREVEAQADETIWQVANRCGTTVPHLCYKPDPGYRADGNCRACTVEVEGERVLAASCQRKPTEGMVVHTDNERARNAQRGVIELLLADQPKRALAHDPDSRFWHWADQLGVTDSRFPCRTTQPVADTSHSAMHVALDACINCNLCVRACREVQVNDVIGMAYRGFASKVVFDQDDPMGDSTCVACGECVQACPTGALMESALVDERGIGKTGKLTEVDSVCPYCGVGCQLTYQVRDNEIVAVQGRNGPSNENRLCVKGRFGFDYIHHPHRLTRPLIRKESAPKGGQLDLDAGNPLEYFREVDWEEALDFAASGLRTIRDRDGGDALAGFGSAKCSNEEAYLFQKLVRSGFDTNNVDHCTRLCHASSVVALLEAVGSGAVSAPFGAVKDADVVMLIGSNPTANHPVAATYFKQAAKNKTLILIDPRKTPLARHARYSLQFNPGTDVAMFNAMLNVIISEKLYDEAFVAERTEGFDGLRRHVEAFTPEAMAPICGIDADTLRTVARTYATAGSSIIFWGMGISQHVHGTDNVRCLIALALITGQIGRPGTGLHPLRGQNNVQGASDAGLIPMVFPDYQPVDVASIRTQFEEAWGVPLKSKPGLTVVEIMGAIHNDEIKGMYIMGENPAMSDPDADHARAALAKLEHLVVQDIFLTETAFHADVILPASAWPEKDGTVTNTNRQVQMGRQALAPPGDARQDWWIVQELAKRIGCDWNYSHPREVFTEMASVMPSLNNITWDRVNSEESVTYPCDGPDVPGNDIVFRDVFPTGSGRGKLVSAEIIPPDETPDEAYPFVLTTGRQLEHWHTGSMTRRAAVLDAIEPEAVACLSPQDMRRLNIEPGSKVKISTRRGAIELTARSDHTVTEGLIFIPFCYAEAPANVLTNAALDPFAKIPEFKYCAARVEVEW
ncbi:formate dehydrogenase subunit alpha [Sedimenticola hydrogenitrophicus]|uniref:formate dehydrogenase subunit alpha n=1 Tax=Sedimenticola hydrogenitrophicus TaxID=2967975 RepID=UPI0023AF124D|nr:formate dehydrogenase subunit alpha [Sedimenticola hydrogenitrophicus]